MWPYDARIRTVAANQPYLPDDHNDIQDKIVDLWRNRNHIRVHGYPSFSGGAATWQCHQHTAGYLHWRCITGGTSSYLCLVIEATETGVLFRVDIKYQIYTATGLNFELFKQDCNFESPSSPAGIGGAITSDTPTATGWGVSELDLSSSPETVGADDLLIVRVNDPDANDEVVGVRADLRPLTAT